MSQILITEKQLEMLSHILITEQDEELTTVEPTEIVTSMSTDINTFLLNLSNKKGGAFDVILKGSDINAITLQIGNGKPKMFDWYPPKYSPTQGEGVAQLRLPVTNDFSNTITIPDLYEKFLAAYPKYKEFFERNNEVTEFVKNQIENLKVNIGFKPTGAHGNITIFPIRKKKEYRHYKKMGVLKKRVEMNKPFSFALLDYADDSNQLYVKGIPGRLTKSQVDKDLGHITLNLPSAGGEVPETVTPQNFNFNTTDNYILNSATLTPAAIQQIQDNILTPIRLLGPNLPAYIQQLNNMAEIVITAFASRDANPDDTEYNSDRRTRRLLFQRCAGQSTLGEYNQCLSAARAQAVVTHLQTTAPQIFGGVNFSAVGGGENITSGNQWFQGKTDHDSATTIGDRNFTINLPPFTTVNPTP